MAGLSDRRRRLLLRGRVGSSGTLYQVIRVLFSCPLPVRAGLFSALLLLSSPVAPAGAQDASDNTSTVPVVVSSVHFSGPLVFPRNDLLLRVRTQPNRRFLGIPGLTWWHWLYQVGESGAVGRWAGNTLMAMGEAPAVLSPSVVRSDVERLTMFFRQEGFRAALVEAVVDTLDSGRRARVTYVLQPGHPTFFRNVRFDGLVNLTDEQRARLARGSLIRGGRSQDEGVPVIDVRSQRYSETLMLEERRRLLTFLRNEGFADVTRDSIRALVFPLPGDSVDVTFQVGTGDRYRFGGVHVDVGGPETDVTARADTIRHDQHGAGAIVSVISGDGRLRPALLARTLQAEPGAWYDQSRLLTTKRRLEATGLFSFTDISTDSVGVGYDGTPTLAHRISLQTRPRHQIRLETFMLQRNSVLTGSENEIGTGVAATYENVNLFGSGEAFRVRTSGSIAADIESRISTSAQTEVSASLAYPYLVRPFAGIERALDLYDARTLLSVSLLAARREELRLIIRGRGSARFRLEMQHSPTISSLVDLVDFSLSNPDTLLGFRREFLDVVLDPLEGDPVQRAQIIEDYTQPQINNALRYTARSSRVNPLLRDRGYAYEASFEVGGNLPYMMDRFLFTPGAVEGSLPGLPFFRGQREDIRLIYRQYARFLVDARQYRPLARNTTLALKATGGLAHPTGGANVVPFDRRFYAGGGSSVRGWGLRELGPGSASFLASGTGTAGEFTNLLGGDIKLEAGAEIRQRVIRNLFAADWSAVAFADAGNVWLGPRNPGTDDGRFHYDRFYSEIGVGSGLGVRLAWDYLILRLDAGYKVYDPAQQKSGIFPDGMKPVFHFGIGHAL
jgi:outer membrane protein insertion porin family